MRGRRSRETMSRSISRRGRVEGGRGVREGVSRDTDAHRAILNRAVSLRAASPEARTRPPRRARASSPDAFPVRKTKNHRFYRRASHLRPRPGHATRGRGAGGHRQAAEQAVRGTRRARERHGVTRGTSHAAHSRVPARGRALDIWKLLSHARESRCGRRHRAPRGGGRVIRPENAQSAEIARQLSLNVPSYDEAFSFESAFACGFCRLRERSCSDKFLQENIFVLPVFAAGPRRRPTPP